MIKKVPSPTLQEREFQPHELFFSTTDRKGIILSGNDIFVRVSGYGSEELLGKPHNIIRHPDMPRCVFKLLWDYLDAGKPIVAYVKNMAADGGYYWVVAVVTPVPDGYLSVRFKPTSDILNLVQGLYRKLLEIEVSNDSQGRKVAMQHSATELGKQLGALGFKSYDEFMYAALRQELQSRDQALRLSGYARRVSSDLRSGGCRNLWEQCEGVLQRIDGLFGSLAGFASLSQMLDNKTAFITKLSRSMQLLSVNACIESARLRECGVTLGVVADQLGVTSRGIAEDVTGLTMKLSELVTLLNGALFLLGTSKLQVEMAQVFIDEIGRSNDAQGSGDPEKKKLVRTLDEALESSIRSALATLGSIEEELGGVGGTIRRLTNTAQTLQFVHMNGVIESAINAGRSNFPIILKNLLKHIADTKSELGELAAAVSRNHGQLKGLSKANQQIQESLTSIQSEVSQFS